MAKVFSQKYSSTFVGNMGIYSVGTESMYHVVYTNVVNTVPYRPVRPEYTVPAGNPVRLTSMFRTGRNTGRTGLVPAVPANLDRKSVV